jgi:hypothetical protein
MSQPSDSLAFYGVFLVFWSQGNAIVIVAEMSCAPQYSYVDRHW